MDIPLPTQDDIYKYGFDKSLNRNTEDVSLINNTEKVIEDMLTKAGINLNTTSSTNSGSSGNFERNDFHWFTLFESIDGYAKNGTPVINQDHVALITGAVIGNTCELQKITTYTVEQYSWDKKRKIRMGVRFETVGTGGSQIIHLVSGVGQNATNTARKIGFKTVNDNLYGVLADGTDFTTLDCGPYNTGVVYNLEASLNPGVEAIFYVNGIKKGIITTNLPTGTTSAHWLMDLEVLTNVGSAKECRITYFDFWQAN